MGDVYPEIKNRREHILQTLTQEEERFARTLDTAIVRLLEILEDRHGLRSTLVTS